MEETTTGWQKQTAPLKASLTAGPIEECQACHSTVPKAWIPETRILGRVVGGDYTGWVSQLTDGICEQCFREVEAKKREAVQRKQLDIARQKLVQKLALILGGERPVNEHTFERYQTTPENDAAYQAMANFTPEKDNVFIWGDPGLGKTHLCHALVRKMLWNGRPTRYLTVSNLILRLRSLPLERLPQEIREYSVCPVLILDEFGEGGDADFTAQILKEIMDVRDARYLGGLVLAGNKSLSESVNKYGRSVASRIVKMFQKQIIRVAGDDMRLRIEAADMPPVAKPFLERKGERRQAERVESPDLKAY